MQFIYLHGFASGPLSSKAVYFRENLEKLGHTVKVPDLNLPDFSTLTISRMLKQLKPLIGSKKTVLIGSSLGGLTAALAAQSHKNVIAMILMAPAFEISSRRVSRLSKADYRNWQKTGFRKYMHYAHNIEYNLHYKFIQDAEKQDAKKFRRKLPTLIFHGIHDEVVPFEVSVNYLQNHHEAKLLLFNSDHSLSDKIQEIWQMSRDFLVSEKLLKN